MLKNNLLPNLTILFKLYPVKNDCSSFDCHYDITWTGLTVTTVKSNSSDIDSFEIFEYLRFAISIVKIVVISIISDDEWVPAFWIKIDVFDAWCFLSSGYQTQKGLSFDLR